MSYSSFNFYDLGPNAIEIITSVPVTTGAPYNYRPLARLLVPNVKKGDLIEVSGMGQVSNEIDPYVADHMPMFGYVVRAGAWGVITKEVTEHLNQNIGRREHHCPFVFNHSWVATADFPNLWIEVSLYAAHSDAQPGWQLVVDQDYARLQAKHYALIED